MEKIAVVAINGTRREFDKPYHYLVPGELSESLLPGMRVIVPFGSGNSLKEGYVLGIAENIEFDRMKSIKKVVDKRPVLTASQITLAEWMKQKYFCTYAAAIKCMLPAGIDVKTLKVVRLNALWKGDSTSPTQQVGSHETEADSSWETQQAGSCETEADSSWETQQAASHETEADSSWETQQAVSHETEASPAKLTPSQKAIIKTLEENDGLLEMEELKRLSKVKSDFSKHLDRLERAGIIRTDEQYSAAVKEKYVRVAGLAMSHEEVETDIRNGVIKRIQQIRILEMLLENEYIAVADLSRFASVSTSVIDTLRKNGYIYFRDIEVKRDPLKHRDVERTLPLKPTREQAEALGCGRSQIESGRFGEILLHGVTGSGKTEVYLQLIEYALELGRQAIVLVPEISLTPQMTDRFRGRFGNRVAVLHSRLSLGERYDQWRLIRNGEVRVVVGARSAVFAPFENLGLIIIDEEHENTYKSETTPKYSAAQIAARRCRQDGALLLYGSATPSIETYHRAEKGEIGLVVLKERANALVMPEVRLVDMRKELEAGNRTMFSSVLSAEIEKNIASGQQTILFLNRRGYSTFVLCRNCGIRLKCRYCSVTMTYHAADDRLICHYCGYTEKMPTSCPECGSTYIRQFGAGTQKIEEDIQKYFPGCSVIRMDMDTTTGKHSHEEILDAFRNKNINILVGTQMIAKGHDFPNVTLVGVLAADSLLGMDDYRASERTFQLLTQVAGRAGRGELPGRVVIQTYNTDDYSIISSCTHDYEAFYRQEADIRRRLRYPPFTNIACIVISSPVDKLAFAKAKETAALLSSAIDQTKGDELLPGPARAPAARLRNRYRWRLLIKCDSQERLTSILSAASEGFCKIKGSSDVDLNMDINPVSMM